MSLEVEVKSLRDEVVALREVIAAFLSGITTQPTAQPVAAVVEEAPTVQPEPETPAPTKPAPKAKKVKPEPVSDEAPTLTADDLKALCMEIVRSDRSKRQAIKDAIASFDGAKTVDKMDPKHYGELLEKLEELE